MFSTKTQKAMGCPITFHLTFKPRGLIERFITIQNGESGSLHTISFLDGKCFHFDDDSWEQRGDTLEMIWSWESEEIFDELQLLATKLIELTVGPFSPWCALRVRGIIRTIGHLLWFLVHPKWLMSAWAAAGVQVTEDCNIQYRMLQAFRKKRKEMVLTQLGVWSWLCLERSHNMFSFMMQCSNFIIFGLMAGSSHASSVQAEYDI